MAEKAEEKTRELMDIRTLMLTSITSALALVVGLFWNDAIKSAIEKLVPQGQDVIAKFISAILVTIIVVIVVYLLFRAQRIGAAQLREIADLKNRIRRKTKGMV